MDGGLMDSYYTFTTDESSAGNNYFANTVLKWGIFKSLGSQVPSLKVQGPQWNLTNKKFREVRFTQSVYLFA